MKTQNSNLPPPALKPQTSLFHMKTKLILPILTLLVAFLGASTVSAAIAERGTATTATTTSTTLTINKPTGVVQGDVMIVNIAQVGNNTTDPSLSGWTLIDGSSLAGTTLRYGAVLYKVAGASEGSNYAFTLGTGVTSAVGDIIAFSGVNTNTTPFDVTPGTITVGGSGATTATATSITTASANAVVIMFAMAAASAPTWSGWTTATSGTLTELYDNQVGTTASVGAAWRTNATAGSTGAGSVTLSTGERNGGILIALKPSSAATQLAFTTEPASTTAGSTMANVVVQIQNASGSSVASNNVPITLTLSSGSFASGNLTTNSDSTGKATFNNLVINAAGSGYTMTAAASGIGAGLASDTSTAFNIIPAAASQLVITNTSLTVTAGVASALITVQRQDPYGNPTTNGTTTVNLTNSSATGVFTNAAGATKITSTNILANASTARFLYANTNAGSVTITNSATGLTSDILVVTVDPAAAYTLTMSQQPSSTATSGSAFAQQPQVTVRDQFGNLVANGTTVSAVETSGGILQGTTNATTTSGVATFGGLNVTNSGTVTLTFLANSHSVVSSSIVVNPAAASQLTIISSPVTLTAGVVSGTITVQSQDPFGNPQTNASAVTVNLTSSSAGATFYSTNGVAVITSTNILVNKTTASFFYKDTVAGSPTITNSASGLTSDTQVETVNPGALDHFAISTISSPQTAGTPITGITITAKDAYNNTVTSFTGAGNTVTYSGTAGITGTSATFSSGVLSSVSLTPVTAGSGKTLIVTGPAGSGSKTGTSTFDVNPGAIASYTVSAATATRGSAFNVTVTAKDAGGNTVTTATTPVTMTSSTGNVQFTGNPATPTSGTFTISALDNYFETVAITATDTNSITGNTSVTINALSGDYRSQANGSWSTAGTWQTWSGSAWTTAVSAPTSATANQISVLSGNRVTNTVSVTAQNLNIASGGTVTIANGQTLTVSNGVANGVIIDGNSNNGILAETNGTFTLNGNNTYGGGTIISGGTISISSDGNLGDTAGGITFNGGTLQTTGPNVVTTARTVTLSTGGGVFSIGIPLYLSGTISGGTGFTTGGNDLILERSAAGFNAVGPITVNSGRLFVFNTNSIGGASISVQNGATVDFSTGGNTTPTNIMTFASGACLANRAGTLTVSTNYVTFPSSGTMIFNSDDAISQLITVNGTYPALTGPLTIQVGGINTNNGLVTLNCAISGSYGLTKSSTGTLVLGSANTYTGGTTVSGGFLTANVTGSLGSGALSIASGATNTLANGTTETVAALYLNGVPQVTGTWGSTAAGTVATHKINYFGSTATGVLNVQSVPTSTALVSSLNPALPGAGVTFTATVTTPVVGGGTPAGTVQFKTNGAAFGAAVTLVSGSASSASISTLPHGSNAITAEYSGGTGFLASTNSLTQVINTPPVGGLQYLTTVLNTPLSVSAATLASLNYDSDGDTLTIIAVGGTSTNGPSGNVTLSGGNLNYTPAAGYVGADLLTYTVSDVYGGTSICTNKVAVTLGKATSVFNYISGSAGTVNLRGYGIPGQQYDVQRSSNPAFPTGSITVVGTVAAASGSGVILFTDTGAPSPSFYRFAVH